MTAPQKEKRGIRCGWCVDTANDHENCVLAVEMETSDGHVKSRTKYPWLCPCECNQRPEFRGRTRCTRCNRRGVVIDEFWHCVDEIECIEFRKKKRQADPMMRQIDEIRAELASNGQTPPIDGEDPKLRRKSRPTTAKAKTGKCICCGEPTRGGRFLPGHDSRYVSSQAAAYDAFPHRHDEGAKAIYDAMEALGPALHAKFIKAVERLRANG